MPDGAFQELSGICPGSPGIALPSPTSQIRPRPHLEIHAAAQVVTWPIGLFCYGENTGLIWANNGSE